MSASGTPAEAAVAPVGPSAPATPAEPAAATGTLRFQEKREAILDAAARLFNQQGIKGGTLADVARSVGLVTNSLTYYYPKKEDLASACLLRAMQVVEDVAEAARQQPTLAGRVEAFIGGYLAVLAAIAEGRQPEMAVFNDVRSLTPPHDAKVFAAYNSMFRQVRRLLGEPGAVADLAAGTAMDAATDVGSDMVIDIGITRQRDALNARAHLLLSTTTWARAWIERYEPADYAAAGQRIADVLLHGLAGPGQVFDVPGPELLPPDKTTTTAPTNTRDAFLRAATRLVNEHGYHGASVDRISAELQLTKGAFYHHHETKEDLISACFERTFSVVRELQTAAARAPGSGWQRLVLACGALVRFQMSAQGPLLRVSAWSALPAALRHDKLRTMGRLGERFAGFIVDGMADGSIRVLDPSVAAQMVNGMVNATVELQRWVPGVHMDNAAMLMARPLLQGLLNSGETPNIKPPALPAAAQTTVSLS